MGIEDEAVRAASETVGKVAADVYADVARPAARQVGTALETLFKVGLSPVAMLDWGFEYSKAWLQNKIVDRLNQTPPDCRRAPPNNVAVPAITAIAMSSDAPELRELYAELLLKAMDSRTEPTVHPSYVGLIGQLTPQEALIFISFRGKDGSTLFHDQPTAPTYRSPLSIEKQFEEYCRVLGFADAERIQLWLENLQRLRLVELQAYSEASYVEPDEDRPYPSVRNKEERYLSLTEYGRAFLDACVPPNATCEP